MSKPLFTTKHYKAIAEWLNRNYRHGIKYLTAGTLARKFGEDNPKFDEDKFLKAVHKANKS